MKNEKYAIMEQGDYGALYIHSNGFNTFDEATERAKKLQSYYPESYFYAIDEKTANCIVTD